MSEFALAGAQFESKLERALDRVRIVLDNAKQATFAAGNVHHQYQDKYLLAECMTNAAAASQVNCLASLGLTQEHLKQACGWAEKSAVSLKFESRESCKFDRKETKEVESATKHVTELSVGGRSTAALTSSTVTTVTEYFWNFEASYELCVVRGVGESAADRLQVLTRTGRVELKTTTEQPPPTGAPETCEVNISWLPRLLDPETLQPGFRIDRDHARCHTPRRNQQVNDALEHFLRFSGWASRVERHFRKLLRVQPDPLVRLDLGAIERDALFVPVLPLFERPAEDNDEEEEVQVLAGPAVPKDKGQQTPGVLACLPTGERPATTVVLDIASINSLLAEEVRALQEKQTSLRESFPNSEAVATGAEAVLVALFGHLSSVCTQYTESIGYIEHMLRKQLIAAIGKEVQPADFAEYMRFHNRKLFAEQYGPSPFCFAIRRSASHSPEGTLSLEEEVTGSGGDSNIPQPIVTLSHHTPKPHMMQFPLGASSSVSFSGERHLHAYLRHQFSGATGGRLQLVARTRQFSSFLVLVGRITSADAFDPKYAAIVKNKDELTVPLDLSTIPTPKEFKDAIESLSPEQQDFAKAFRSMQLESTLFGILVIQIKPQLERVLNLPEDCLTKEIQLTQDLMELFIKYQIPSDLLSFDAEARLDRAFEEDGLELVGEASSAERVSAVRRHVSEIQKMIATAKEEEIQERVRERQYEQPRSVLSQRREELEEEGAPRPRSAPRGRGGPPPGAMMMKCAAMPASSAGPPPPPMPASCPVPSPPPSAPGPPPPAPSPPQQSQQPQQQQQSQVGGLAASVTPGIRDYTQVPKDMDKSFEQFDTDGALRPTIINPGKTWSKSSQAGLLAKPTTSSVASDEQKKERDAAFDLLDALTKSGALPVEHASLHVVVMATHCFDKTVTETVIQDNSNPIEKVERSTLIMASTIHQLPPAALLQDSQLPRVSAASPQLFVEDGQA